MALIVLADADQELRSAQNWYDARQDGLGDAVFAEFLRVAALIERYPNAWDPLPGGYRRIRLNRFPYGVVYRIEDGDIVVTAFAHHSRRPDYWRKR